MTTIRAFVPARGGSLRLPGKNLMRIGGKTLIRRAIEQGIAVCGTVYVSTDCDDIAGVASGIPNVRLIDRPSELSGPKAPTSWAILHAATRLGWDCSDWVLLLQPTSPLRRIDDIMESIEYAYKRLPSYSTIGYEDISKNNTAPNGAVYCAPIEFWASGFPGMVSRNARILMSERRSIDINTAEQFEEAEKRFIEAHP